MTLLQIKSVLTSYLVIRLNSTDTEPTQLLLTPLHVHLNRIEVSFSTHGSFQASSIHTSFGTSLSAMCKHSFSHGYCGSRARNHSKWKVKIS